MIETRRVSIAQAGVIFVGAAVTLGALLVAASRLRVDGSILRDTCSTLLSEHDLLTTAALALGGMGVLVIARTAWMLLRLGTAHRRGCRRLRLVDRHRGALIVVGERPQAFCGGLLSPRVYATAGARAVLSDEEFDRVVAHERHHAARRDPLRAIAARSAAFGLFFLPVLRDLQREHALLAEIAADAAAASGPADRRALAAALLAFDRCGAGIEPERVDHLCGVSVTATVPVRPMAVAIASSGAVLAASLFVALTAATGGIGSLTVTPHALLIFAVGVVVVAVTSRVLRRRVLPAPLA
ncbi:MAG: hypothetical protein SFX73_22035 [Kofleriaceae bacterium]|nr:hypothetical protein [Kofleriaceae bacterium]